MKTALTLALAIILALLLSAPSAKAQLFPSAEIKKPVVVKAKIKKSKQVRRAKIVRRTASRRTVVRGRTAARVAPQAPTRAAASVQIGDATPIRPTEVKTISVPNRFNATFDALDNFATRFNAVYSHNRSLKAMTDTIEQDIERAVAEAVQIEPEAAVQAYPVEGINLGPAFTILVERLQTLRNDFLKMITSATNREFARQRELLVEIQSLTRAFDVLAGFVSPYGHQLSPMVEPDPAVLAG